MQLPESVSLRFLKHYHVIGLSQSEDAIFLAMMDPEDQFVIDALMLATGKADYRQSRSALGN